MRKSLFLIVLTGCVSIGAASLSARKPFVKPVPKKGASAVSSPSVDKERYSPYDTVGEPSRDSIAVAGFEKTLRSTRESMYVTNHTADTVMALGLSITYTDTDDRMLHRALHEVSVEIPPAETRLIDVASFDRQGLYYYYLSIPPAKARRATPFKAKAKVVYFVRPNPEKK